ncbi:MAG: hypothetical protein HQ523_14905 [Lentisphaerae bacterium]|nr:hypothetical protein [Lentisphaerota bacterium]
MDEKQPEARDEETKRPYQPPEIKVVELATEEVLGTGCKTLSDVVPTAVCGSSACGTQVGS